MTDAKAQILARLSIAEVLDVPTSQPRHKPVRCRLNDHEDRTPSMFVDVAAQSFRCYGCKRGGSVIDAVGYLNVPGYHPDRDFAAALKLAAESVGVGAADTQGRPQRRSITKAVRRDYLPPVHHAEAKPESRGYSELCQSLVKITGTPGMAYLAERGIPEGVAVAARCRYAPDSQPAPRVVFPTHQAAPDSRPIRAGISARLAFDPIPAELARYKWLTLKAEGSWLPGNVFYSGGTWPATMPPAFAITEAQIDALSLAACGLPAFAVIGKTLPAWLPPLCIHRTVYTAHDADDAGEIAAELWGPYAPIFGITLQRLRPPVCKDLNAALLQIGLDELTRYVDANTDPFARD